MHIDYCYQLIWRMTSVITQSIQPPDVNNNHFRLRSISLTLLAAVDELSSVDALSCDEELSPLLETVWVTEGHFGQGGTATGVMDDVLTRGQQCLHLVQCKGGSHLKHTVMRLLVYLHNPLDVTMALSEVNMAEFSGAFSVLDVGLEHRARTFSLSPDHTSHRVLQ